ncbi:hypothetical protein HOY82DRAFT_599104 [Tuber indicum]|nr:hypothetical protein HOY82DRAFT_599104 [Tuber indicum]
MTFNPSDDDEANSRTTNNDQLANGIAVGDMKAEFLKELTHYLELSRRRTTSAAILHGTTFKDAIPPTASPDPLINVKRKPNRRSVRGSVGRQSS